MSLRSELLQRIQEVRAICKTRNQLVGRVSSLDSFNRCDLLRILGGTFVTADQRGYHQYPIEPCSCRTRSSTGTNTLPLVVVFYALGLFVVRDTEGLRGLLACSWFSLV